MQGFRVEKSHVLLSPRGFIDQGILLLQKQGGSDQPVHKTIERPPEDTFCSTAGRAELYAQGIKTENVKVFIREYANARGWFH